MKKGYSRGVVSCDPGICGLAFTIYIPSIKFTKSLLYNLKDHLPEGKTYKNIFKPKYYVPLLVSVMWELKENEIALNFCDRLIIESQYQQNMNLLLMNICTLFMHHFPWIKIDQISPLTCKRQLNIEYGGGHANNKSNALEYVRTHKKELIAGDTVIDHNTADSIIILNTWLKVKNRHFYTNLEDYATPVMEVFDERGFLTFDMKNTWLKCPICEYDTGRLLQITNQDKNPKNYLACFIKCQNTKCGANAFLGTADVRVKDNKLGSKKFGFWEISKGENKPRGFGNDKNGRPSRSADDESDDSPPLKRRKLNSSEGDDPLQKIVLNLAQEQNSLKDTLLDIEKKNADQFAKLFAAFAQNYADTKEVVEKPTTPARGSKAKPPPKKRTPEKFDTNIDITD